LAPDDYDCLPTAVLVGSYKEKKDSIQIAGFFAMLSVSES